MMHRTIALVMILVLAPALASAQASPTAPRPDYTASIALHITAVTLAVGSTAAFFVGMLFAIGSAIGGASGSADPAQTPLLIGGTVGLLAAVGVGIAATVVHFSTRNGAHRTATVAWQPLAWASPMSAGGGFVLSF